MDDHEWMVGFDRNLARQLRDSATSPEDYLAKIKKVRENNDPTWTQRGAAFLGKVGKPFVEVNEGLARGARAVSDLVGGKNNRVSKVIRKGERFFDDAGDQLADATTGSGAVDLAGETIGNLAMFGMTAGAAGGAAAGATGRVGAAARALLMPTRIAKAKDMSALTRGAINVANLARSGGAEALKVAPFTAAQSASGQTMTGSALGDIGADAVFGTVGEGLIRGGSQWLKNRRTGTNLLEAGEEALDDVPFGQTPDAPIEGALRGEGPLPVPATPRPVQGGASLRTKELELAAERARIDKAAQAQAARRRRVAQGRPALLSPQGKPQDVPLPPAVPVSTDDLAKSTAAARSRKEARAAEVARLAKEHDRGLGRPHFIRGANADKMYPQAENVSDAVERFHGTPDRLKPKETPNPFPKPDAPHEQGASPVAPEEAKAKAKEAMGRSGRAVAVKKLKKKANNRGFLSAQLLGPLAGATTGGLAGGVGEAETTSDRLQNMMTGAGVGAAMAAGAPMLGAVATGPGKFGIKRLFSRVERAIEEAPEKASGSNWKGFLASRSAKGEREWTGVDQFLDANADKMLTKDEVKQVFEANKIKLEERQYGDDPSGTRKAPEPHIDGRAEFDGIETYVDMTKADDNGGPTVVVSLHDQMDKFLVAWDGGTRTFKGGEEAMAKARAFARKKFKKLGSQPVTTGHFPKYTLKGGDDTDYQEIVVQHEPEAGRKYENKIHWPGDYNPIVHLRRTVRTLGGALKGKRAMFLQEIQSDWHQAGRKGGYVGDEASIAAVKERHVKEQQEARQVWTDAEKALSDHIEVGIDLLAASPSFAGADVRAMTAGGDKYLIRDFVRHLAKKGDSAAKEWGARFNAVSTQRTLAGTNSSLLRGPPPSPVDPAPMHLTPEWTALALKRAVVDAVENGLDRIVLPTPAQVIEAQQWTGLDAVTKKRIAGAHAYYGEGGIVSSTAKKVLQKQLRMQGIDIELSMIPDAVRKGESNLVIEIGQQAKEKVLKDGVSAWATPGATLGAIGAVGGAMAQDAQTEDDNTVSNTMLGIAAAGGALLAGKRFLPGAKGATRLVRGAANREIREAEMRAAGKIVRDNKLNPIDPNAKGVNPYVKVPELANKTGRDHFPFQMFDGIISDESRDLLNARVIEQASITRGVPKKVVSHAETVRDAARLLRLHTPEEIALINPKNMSREHTVALAGTLADRRNHLEGLYGELEAAVKASDSELVSNLETKIGLLEVDAAQMTRALGSGLSEHGRNLNAAKLNTVLLEGPAFVNRAAKFAGRELTTAEITELNRLTSAKDKLGAIRYAMSLNEPGMLRQTVALINAGRLSGVVGRVRDLGSGLINLGTEGVVNAPVRVAVDKVMSRITGRRTSLMPGADDLKAMVRGIDGNAEAKGITGGAKELWTEDMGVGKKNWMQHQRETPIDQNALSRSEIPDVVDIKDFTGVEAIDNTLDALQKSVYRITAGVDKVTKGGARGLRTMELARLQAADELKQGLITQKDLTKRIQEIARNPDDFTREQANKFAQETTFQNDGGAAAFAKAVKTDVPRRFGEAMGKLYGPVAGRTAENRMKAAVDFVVPFAKTTSNIASRVIDYTPFGLVRGVMLARDMKMLMKTNKLTVQQMDRMQRKVTERISRSITGGAIFAGAEWGFDLHKQGLMAGSYPLDAAEREAWEAEGKKPNSLLVGDEWVPVGQFSPVGNAMAVGANLSEMLRSGNVVPGAMNMTVAAIASANRSVMDQPLATGISSLMAATSDPKKFAGWVGQTGASLVPTIMNDIAVATDDGRARLKDRTDVGHLIGQTMQERIPGLRQKLPLDYDVFGRVRRNRSTSPTAVFNPFTGPPAKHGREIDALKEAKGAITSPRREKGESVKAYSERKRRTGLAVRGAVRDRMDRKPLTKVTDEESRDERKDELRKASSRGRANLKAAMRQRAGG